MSPLFTTALFVAGAYLLGSFNAGYYLVRLRKGADVREFGSGSSGATNVGRLLGWPGFLITLLLDAGKGAAGVCLARMLGLQPAGLWLGAVALVAGHVWPIQLRGRGGKGIAPYLGIILAWDWRLAAALPLLALPWLLLFRRYRMAGLGAVALAPLVAWQLDPSMPPLVGLGMLGALILVAHRDNIRDERALT